MAEKLNKFEKFEKDFSPVLNPDDWPDALDCLTIGLVANKYTKHGKISENLILSI